MEMIRKLRRRLVSASMLSLLLVLFTIVSAVSLLNYRELVTDADQILDLLADNGGTFPEFGEGDFPNQMAEEGSLPAAPTGENPPPELPSGENSMAEPPTGEALPPEFPSGENPMNFPGRRGYDDRRDRWLEGMSAELPYETRYFTVTAGADGSLSEATTQMGRIAAISAEEAVSLAEKVLQSGKTRGFSGDYRYLVSRGEEETLLLFLDRGRNLSTFRLFLLTSCGISLLGLLIVFALITFFSGRIIRPFVDNYEKQRRFITDAGHELKTPLAIIEADTDVLEMDLEEENEWLLDIKKQTRRLADLTKNLIALARSEEGGTQYTMIDFPVSDVVEEAADSYRAPAMASGKDFSVHTEPLLSLHGDEAAIRQLTGILLDNALKYSGEKGRISLSLGRQGKNLKLVVFNTAENVSRENLPHLFERFYRTDASRNSGTGGYGIGLSIAQAIVSAHKGRIFAETADEKSLSITVLLPGCSRAEPEEEL